MKTKGLDEFEKTLIYVLGSIDELIEQGLIERTEPCYSLEIAGKQAYLELRDAGFKPKKKMLVAAMYLFKKWEAEHEALDENGVPA